MKKKVTFYISQEVLRAAKVRAARTDRKESEVVEAALRDYLGFTLMDRIWARAREFPLTDEEAMELAVSEQHAWREEQARAARGD
jgi:hypothetical protein